jgi:hypothetical protein
LTVKKSITSEREKEHLEFLIIVETIQLRWYKSVDGSDYKLQFREGAIFCWGDWKDVPFVLEVVETETIRLPDGTPVAP